MSPALLSSPLTRQNTRLSTAALKLLELKRQKLLEPTSQVPEFIQSQLTSKQASSRSLAEAARSVFVFAQEEAGTAVCIAADGILLTCSHCVGETAKDAIGRSMWLISVSGVVVKTTCTAWDGKRDLALLRITAASEPSEPWSCINISTNPVKTGIKIMCIGHPGSEDLEAARSGIPTGYDVLHISDGRYRGCADQDVHDNSEIGALQHTAWTYWGHSGSPLIETATGRLIGLHSSWDDETGMRRGVALEAIITFLQRHGALPERVEPQLLPGASAADAIVLD